MAPTAEVLEPGMVVVRGILSPADEARMAREAWGWGTNDPSYGFFKEDKPNAAEGRGRLYDAAERFPGWVKDVCDQAVAKACASDPAMPSMDFTHLIVNCYLSSEGLQMHRDCYENDGTSDHPVVNLTLGAACVFAWKHERDDPEKTVVLESGDVLLFGGPCRLVLHGVREVLLQRAPGWMDDFEPGRMRFSLTFRDTPEIRGREDEFKYFKFSSYMPEQEAFDLAARKQRGALPRAYQPPAVAGGAGA